MVKKIISIGEKSTVMLSCALPLIAMQGRQNSQKYTMNHMLYKSIGELESIVKYTKITRIDKKTGSKFAFDKRSGKSNYMRLERENEKSVI